MNQNCSSSNRKCVLQELQEVGREIMLLPKKTLPFDEFYSNIIEDKKINPSPFTKKTPI
jgi:hypothetical protein